MALASTSRIQMRYILETVLGTIPTVGNSYDLRVTGESFNYDLTKETSKEINSSRTTLSQVSVSASSAGGIQAELSYAEFDRILASLMESTWTVYGTNGVQGTPNTTTTATATTLTASPATAGNDSYANLKKGQWFLFLHPTSANDGKLFRVSTSVAPTTTVITLDANTPAAVVGSTAGGAVCTSRLTHGTTITSFTIEKQMLDVGQYFAYKGQVPSKATISAASGSLTTLAIDFMGLGTVRNTSTNIAGATTNTASLAYTGHSAVSNPQSLIWEGGAPVAGTYIKSISLEYDNAIRQQSAIGSLAPVDVAAGTIAAKATLSMYFANGTIYDKFIANTSTSLIWASLDPSGNGYIFSMPVCNITSFKVTAGGKDQDLMAEVVVTLLEDRANADATLRKEIFIDRVGVAVTP